MSEALSESAKLDLIKDFREICAISDDAVAREFLEKANWDIGAAVTRAVDHRELPAASTSSVPRTTTQPSSKAENPLVQVDRPIAPLEIGSQPVAPRRSLLKPGNKSTCNCQMGGVRTILKTYPKCACFWFLTIFLLVFILPFESYSRVGPQEIALKENVVTGLVFKDPANDEVYGQGAYFWTPSFGVRTFPLNDQFVDFTWAQEGGKSLAVFPDADGDGGGLEFALGLTLQYKLNKDSFMQLFLKFITPDAIHAQVAAVATARLKVLATQFGVNDYRFNRRKIRLGFIEGTINNETQAFEDGLKKALKDQVFVDLTGLQLGFLDFSDQLKGTWQTGAKQSVLAAKANYDKEVAEVAAETERRVQEIVAKQTVVVAAASANATRLREEGEAYALGRRGAASYEGIRLIYDTFGVTSPTDRAKFMQLFKLLEGDSAQVINAKLGGLILNNGG